MNIYKRENLRIKNIRKIKKQVNAVVKLLNKNGVTAVHCKRNHDSHQMMIADVNETVGRDILKDDSYLIFNKIREGKFTTPDKLYLLWKGDKLKIQDLLESAGLNTQAPKDDKTTFIINIDLWCES